MAREVTLLRLLESVSPEYREVVLDKAGQINGVDAVVMYGNLDLCSSRLGDRSVMLVGSGCTYSLDKALEGHLNDLPSQRQYPVMYAYVTPNLIIEARLVLDELGEEKFFYED